MTDEYQRGDVFRHELSGVIQRKYSDKLFGFKASVIIPDEITPRVHNKYHKTAPADAIYVGRGSPWGNPLRIGEDGTREEVIDKFKRRVLPYLDLRALTGRHLVCFCKPKACHADSLFTCANSEEYMSLQTLNERTDWIKANT